MKKCSKCRLEKPLSDFYKLLDGWKCWCKACCLKDSLAYRTKNAERLRQRKKEQYSKNSEEIRRRQKIYKDNLGAEERRLRAIKRTYRITETELRRLESEQGGRCAICGDSFSSSKDTCIDHIHDSSPPIVRGILCVRCNFGLGYFKDSTERLSNAVEYLKKFQK